MVDSLRTHCVSVYGYNYIDRNEMIELKLFIWFDWAFEVQCSYVHTG